MLQNLRNVGKTWVGKAVVGVLFTLLILSFAVWGIGDIFRGGATTTVVRVGETEIDAQDGARHLHPPGAPALGPAGTAADARIRPGCSASTGRCSARSPRRQC